MSDAFFKIWIGFCAVVALVWLAFLIWGGAQLIEILRGLVQ